ncbi:MAG TPA: hypothetical protein VN714_20600 [Trebonia sp.]|jgi:hypothetical protein|nr:hypothetical protein [Trebonia sp.]
MNAPQETELGYELRQLVSDQPFAPDIEAIGLRARKRHRRGIALRGATAAGVAAVAAVGVFTAVHTTGGATAGTTASGQSAGISQQSSTVSSPLVTLAANITANSHSQSGNASLIIRTQTDGNIPPQVSYNLYTDGGAYYAGGDKRSLRQAVARHEDMADGITATEVKTALYAAAGNLASAREQMATVLPGDQWFFLTGAAQRAAWEKGAAQERVILKEKGIKTPLKMPTGKALQSIIDNRVWNNSVDALSAGGGNPQVRAGVLRLLSTISAVTVAHSTSGGQPALTLTAGPEVFGGQGEQVLTINAKTGMPIKSVEPANGNVPSSTDTFQVSRVTLADIKAGRF